MRIKSIAFATAVLALLLAVSPQAADAGHLPRLNSKVEICHLDGDEQGTMEVSWIAALLHLFFHEHDYQGACDVLPS